MLERILYHIFTGGKYIIRYQSYIILRQQYIIKEAQKSTQIPFVHRIGYAVSVFSFKK